MVKTTNKPPRTSLRSLDPLTAKSLAGSVLAQANTDKETGKDMKRKAAMVFGSDNYSDATKI